MIIVKRSKIRVKSKVKGITVMLNLDHNTTLNAKAKKKAAQMAATFIFENNLDQLNEKHNQVIQVLYLKEVSSKLAFKVFDDGLLKVDINELESSDSLKRDIEALYDKFLSTSQSDGFINRVLNTLSEIRTLISSQRFNESQRRIKELEEAIKKDHLSNLFNRSYFDRTLSTLFKKNNKKPLALLMIDADNFKSINDQYGHQVGDQAIQHIAKIIQDCIRPSDKAFRYGGEEFSVILPKTKEADALRVARRVQEALCEKPMVLKDGASLVITASIGLSSNNQSAGTLIKEADLAVYAVKDKGKNNYLSYAALKAALNKDRPPHTLKIK